MSLLGFFGFPVVTGVWVREGCWDFAAEDGVGISRFRLKAGKMGGVFLSHCGVGVNPRVGIVLGREFRPLAGLGVTEGGSG